MIDLRSDTVTKPTSGMREAMFRAEVGDDVIDIDPTLDALQRRTAELLGKEAAIFMPSGTMTNQIALRVHCKPGDEFLCDSDCHIYNYEQGAFAQLSGLVARTIQGKQGVLKVEDLRGAVRPINEHMVQTRLLCLENTHNRGSGKVQPQSEVVSVCKWAHDSGLQTHLDGARLFNASVATGLSLKELSEPFDSVSVCFSKGLGAPIGSCLAGTKDFVARARRARKLFGGGMRQVGVVASAALYALDHHVERLAIDHQHAKQLAATVREFDFLTVMGGEPETNILIFHVAESWGSAPEFALELEKSGVRVMAFSPTSIRMVTHLDVSSEEIHRVCEMIRRVGNSSKRN
jgi:threonine aldolase